MLLAQSNIALSIWPLDDPRMEGFVSRLAAINQLAESSAGFVWRHTDDYDSAGRSPPFDHPLLFFNMSVWTDLDSLRNYVFRSEHVQLLRRKSELTGPAGIAPLAMWWISADGPMPTVSDAIARFIALENEGEACADVFGFANAASHPSD
jgi:hypothetical protein